MQTEPHVPEVQPYARKDESCGVGQPQTAREHRDQGGYEQKEAKLAEIRLHRRYRSYSPTVAHTNISPDEAKPRQRRKVQSSTSVLPRGATRRQPAGFPPAAAARNPPSAAPCY
jgi:hypothetical protein